VRVVAASCAAAVPTRLAAVCAEAAAAEPSIRRLWLEPRPLAGDEVLRNWQAVAEPLTSRYPVSPPRSSSAPTHLYAHPACQQAAVATDWFYGIIEHRQFVRLKLIPSEHSGLTAGEHRHLLPDSPSTTPSVP